MSVTIPSFRQFTRNELNDGTFRHINRERRDWIWETPIQDAFAVLGKCSIEELGEMVENFYFAGEADRMNRDNDALRKWQYALHVISAIRCKE